MARVTGLEIELFIVIYQCIIHFKAQFLPTFSPTILPTRIRNIDSESKDSPYQFLSQIARNSCVESLI